MKKTIVISLFMLLTALSLAAATYSVDFNNTSDLNTYFNPGLINDMTNVSNSGIGDTGSVDVPYMIMGNSRILTYKNGFLIDQLNEPITVSAYFNNVSTGGYGSIGFSSASSNNSDPYCHIKNTPALGMSFHGGGAYLLNNLTRSTFSTYIPDIAYSWYKLVFTITPRGDDFYSVNYKLYLSDANGTIGAVTKQGSGTILNSTLANGRVYPYFGIDGLRISNIDDFSFTIPGEVTLPVTMSSFSATATSQTLVRLQWTTESESNILGFNVYRSDDTDVSHAVKLNAGYVEAINSSLQHSYSYSDSEFESGFTYYYWVESAEMNSNSSFYGPVSVFTGSEGEVVPPTVEGNTRIVKVFPNPFSPDTEIAYKLRDTANVTIGIYNLKGQLIRSLVNSTEASGDHQICWDGKDNNGNHCSSGLYFARMQAGSVNSFHKLMLIK